jgi:hypothetical protein
LFGVADDVGVSAHRLQCCQRATIRIE